MSIIDKDGFFKLMLYFDVAQFGDNSADVPAVDFNDSATKWTTSGSINLSAGSPTSVALLSGVSGVEEIEIHIEGFSTNTANQAALIQLGDSGGLEILGYSGAVGDVTTASARETNSSGFLLTRNATQDAANAGDFDIVLRHLGSNIWSCDAGGVTSFVIISESHGLKTLSGNLTQVSITTEGGSATFDGGTAHVRHR